MIAMHLSSLPVWKPLDTEKLADWQPSRALTHLVLEGAVISAASVRTVPPVTAERGSGVCLCGCGKENGTENGTCPQAESDGGQDRGRPGHGDSEELRSSSEHPCNHPFFLCCSQPINQISVPSDRLLLVRTSRRFQEGGGKDLFFF